MSGLLEPSFKLLHYMYSSPALPVVSYLKMNALRLHLVDTDAWSYYVPALPVVSNTSAYTPLHVYYPDDLAELVAWGRDRGVVVYPEVDFPFHASVSVAVAGPEEGGPAQTSTKVIPSSVFSCCQHSRLAFLLDCRLS